MRWANLREKHRVLCIVSTTKPTLQNTNKAASEKSNYCKKLSRNNHISENYSGEGLGTFAWDSSALTYD